MIRIFMGLVAALGAFLAAYWGTLVVAGVERETLALGIGAASALGVGWTVWSNATPGSLVWMTFRGGFVLGGIGFAAGFFGPLLLTPEAN